MTGPGESEGFPLALALDDWVKPGMLTPKQTLAKGPSLTRSYRDPYTRIQPDDTYNWLRTGVI